MTVGERLKKLRLERGWTQTELGSAIGLTKGAIHKYETGQIKGFKRDAAYKLAILFETSPLHFIFDDIPKERSGSTMTDLHRNMNRVYAEMLLDTLQQEIDENDKRSERLGMNDPKYIAGIRYGLILAQAIIRNKLDYKEENINE